MPTSNSHTVRDGTHFGMAAGAATLMTPGTELCYQDDVERLYMRSSRQGRSVLVTSAGGRLASCL